MSNYYEQRVVALLEEIRDMLSELVEKSRSCQSIVGHVENPPDDINTTHRADGTDDKRY